MPIREISIANYRSIRGIRHLIPGDLNVIVGPNGSGKTNLYRSLYLLHAAAEGRFARAMLEEGGMPSALWRGPRRKGPVRVKLSLELDHFDYELEFGLPVPNPYTMFGLDPLVKVERVHERFRGKRVCMLERTNSAVWARDAEGKRTPYPYAITPSESVMSELREPAKFPELSALRQELLSWRFYHSFRTDSASPLRRPQPGVYTPVLSHDGVDTAAALQTVAESGNAPAMREAIEHAFPGAQLCIGSGTGGFSVGLKMPEFMDPFSQAELSDGTLHYLCLLAALLSPRPPTLLAINEPESSLHPTLYPALAKLIARAAKQSQIWLTTHSESLADLLDGEAYVKPIRLEKIDGETRIAGFSALGIQAVEEEPEESD